MTGMIGEKNNPLHPTHTHYRRTGKVHFFNCMLPEYTIATAP